MEWARSPDGVWSVFVWVEHCIAFWLGIIVFGAVLAGVLAGYLAWENDTMTRISLGRFHGLDGLKICCIKFTTMQVQLETVCLTVELLFRAWIVLSSSVLPAQS